jgi:hypothetical protein
MDGLITGKIIKEIAAKRIDSENRQGKLFT